MSVVRRVAAGRTQWMGRLEAQRTARLLAVTGLVIMPTVLTSCQQVQDLATTWTTQHVDGPSLEGTYRFIYDASEGRANGAPIKVQSDKVMWAFQSACQRSGCVATGTALDRDDAHAPLSPALHVVLRYTGKHWEGLPSKVPVVTQGPCLGPGNTVVSQAEVTNAESWQLWTQPDGTLQGRLNATVLSNECGGQGTSLNVPLTGTRAGDVAPEIKVENPDVAARELPAAGSNSPGPVFNGTYRFRFASSARTNHGIPAPAFPFDDTAVWSMRSTCTSPTHCIATGSNPYGTPRAMVLESAGDTWQTLSPTLHTVMCVRLPISATTLLELSLDAGAGKAIHGTLTTTVLSNECGDMGAVYSTPVAIEKTGDPPASDIEIADPALFLP